MTYSMQCKGVLMRSRLRVIVPFLEQLPQRLDIRRILKSGQSPARDGANSTHRSIRSRNMGTACALYHASRGSADTPRILWLQNIDIKKRPINFTPTFRRDEPSTDTDDRDTYGSHRRRIVSVLGVDEKPRNGDAVWRPMRAAAQAAKLTFLENNPQAPTRSPCNQGEPRSTVADVLRTRSSPGSALPRIPG